MTTGSPQSNKPYAQLLDPWRFRRTSKPGRSAAVEAESDRGRILYSAAFRRLGQKAQVFSLEPNGSVRTRLTHSLEVAQIGGYISQLALEQMSSATKGDLGLIGREDAFQRFVETACLVHDLGNPPFGHFGELAIRHWFADNQRQLMNSWLGKAGGPRSARANVLFEDFLCFDGNPQGFRILTRLQWNTDEYGLNLTAPQLASVLKYSCDPSGVSKSDKLSKKPGYFHTEATTVRLLKAQLGLDPASRHPLVYLMEAADDIAYCWSDIEDAIEKGLFTEHMILEEISREIGEASLDVFSNMVPHRSADDESVPLSRLLRFRTSAINKMVALVAAHFATNQEAYLSGKIGPITEQLPDVNALLELLKNHAKKRIYKSKLVLRNEIVASTVIRGILNAYLPVLEAPPNRFACARAGRQEDDNTNYISFETSLIAQLPRKHLTVYDYHLANCPAEEKDFMEPFYRMHLLVDFLSGMTDDYAFRFFRIISGEGSSDA